MALAFAFVAVSPIYSATTKTMPFSTSVNVTFDSTQTAQFYDVLIPGFDPALGTLTSVSLSDSRDYGVGDVYITFTNNAATAQSAYFTESYSFALLFNNASTGKQDSVDSGSGSSQTGSPRTISPGGTYVDTFDGVGGGGSGSVPSKFDSDFVGAGPIHFQLKVTGPTSTSSNSNITRTASSGSSVAEFDFSGTYRYTPAPAPVVNPVPEPSETGLFLMAGLLILPSMRRWRSIRGSR